jgi:hypothetical protein
MKTATLPSVRVEPYARERIESVLKEGETLSAFVENAALREAHYRSTEAEFLQRGRASLANARATGKTVSMEESMARLDGLIKERFGMNPSSKT